MVNKINLKDSSNIYMENQDKPKRRYTRYNTDEERRQARLERSRQNNKKRWTCPDCNSTLLLAHKARHFESKKHINSI